jgi:hypothetical protein
VRQAPTFAQAIRAGDPGQVCRSFNRAVTKELGNRATR